MTGDLAALRALLDAGADPGEQDKHGRTALYAAAAVGAPGPVSLLLSHGADPNAAQMQAPMATPRCIRQLASGALLRPPCCCKAARVWAPSTQTATGRST